MDKVDSAVRTLLLDIESSPNIAYVWGKYEQNVLGDFLQERQIISFAWKWLGDKNTQVMALPSFKNYKPGPFYIDNSELVLALHKLVSQADIIIGHNLIQFDDKMANTDFILQGLTPPPPHKTVDTLAFARTKFSFNSNKLDDLGARLKLGRKKKTGGFELWVRCMNGEPKAWHKMMEYNKQDVTLLEEIYLKLRPWMSNHPPVMRELPGICCTMCTGFNLKVRGYSRLKYSVKRRYQCGDCGKWDSQVVNQRK